MSLTRPGRMRCGYLVLDLLRLGAHQLLAMRVPSHAAVSATVELARAAVGDGRAAFVNAVLRKVAVHGLDDWVARVAPDPDADPVGHLSVATSHPRWVVDAMRTGSGRSPPPSSCCGRTTCPPR